MDLFTQSISLLNPPLSDLVDELCNIRADRFAHTMEDGPVMVFLTAFFLPDDQTKFVSIRPDEVGENTPILNSRVRDFSDLTIHTLLSELASLNNDSHENHVHQRLYVALNALMRPICEPMKKQKQKPLSARKRLELQRRRNRDF